MALVSTWLYFYLQKYQNLLIMNFNCISVTLLQLENTLLDAVRPIKSPLHCYQFSKLCRARKPTVSTIIDGSISPFYHMSCKAQDRQKRCWNNVHKTWRKFVMQREERARKKRQQENLSTRLIFFIHAPFWLIIIPLSPINLINFHHLPSSRAWW